MQKNGIPLIKETIRIVENFISKNMIKAITIEETSDKLIIMEKQPAVPSQFNSTNDLCISQIAANIKMEKEEREDVQSPVYTMDIEYSKPELASIIETIKEEPIEIETIKEEPIEIDSSIVEFNDLPEPKQNNLVKESPKITTIEGGRIIQENYKSNEHETFSLFNRDSIKQKEDFYRILSINKQLSSLVQDLTNELEEFHKNLSNSNNNT